MNVNVNDYAVVQQKGGKPFLMRVNALQKDGKSVIGILENNRRQEYKSVEVSSKEIITSLGPNPPPGKVYNLDVSNLYRKSFEHEFWGNIHFYVKLDSVVLKMFRKSLDHTAKLVDKAGLESYVSKSEIEVRAKHGKWAGMYKHVPKGKSVTWFAPEWADGNNETMDYIIVHEFGHVVRYNGLGNALKLREKWLRLYQQVVSPVVIPQKATLNVWKKLERAKHDDDEVGFTEALKDISAEDEKYEVAVKVILKWLRQVQHIGAKELQLAWSAGALDFIEGVWPTSAIDSSKLTPVITEYSTKNVEELFAECFALRLTKKKLPDAYADLTDRSILWAKKSSASDED